MANVKVSNDYPSIKVESVDVFSDYFTLSQFQMVREDREVTHVPDETV